MDEVKLIGMWPSPFYYRVLWGLKLKGVTYEYIEEDLANKSPLLLQSNPVHKKIPVLLHGGKPVCESMVILEYIEEAWPRDYPLMPSDPRDRALARFWYKFIDDKSLDMWRIYRSKAEEQEEAVKNGLEVLKTLEEFALAGGKKKFFGGEKIGLVDLAYGGLAHWLGVIEEVVGVKLMDEKRFPRLCEWAENFRQAPVIRDNLPDRDQLFAFFKKRREMLLASTH